MATNNKTLLLLAGAGVAGYFLLSKNATTTTTDTSSASALPDVALSPTDTSAAAAATGVSTTVVSAAAAASAAIMAKVPDAVGQLAIQASTDLLTTVAVVWYDAIVNNHPNEYSTKYFLASQDTWNSALAAYKASGLPELAAQSGLDQVATLAVVFFDAQFYNHPTELSTKYFLASRETWQIGLTRYQQQGRVNGLAGAGGFYLTQFAGALPAAAPALAAAQAPVMAH